MTRLLYSLDDAAGELSISRRVLDRLISEAKIDTVRIGRRRLVPHEALEDYIARLVASA